jgi:hypothetical protein
MCYFNATLRINKLNHINNAMNDDAKFIFENYKQILEEKKKSKKLDKVGKEDADVNNDGKVDSTDTFLLRRRHAIAKQIGRKVKKEEEEAKCQQEEEEMGAKKSEQTVKRAQVDIHNFLKNHKLKTAEIVSALQGVLNDYATTGSVPSVPATASTLGAGTEPMPTPGSPAGGPTTF